ncbi:hypothetical protein K1719_037678 [Acacia pycnantha]|nr:hypothetical protein K1719_037678 [Acacia pycnantha]
MASERGNVEFSDTVQDVAVQQSSNKRYNENWHMGKALAYRAVYGCGGGGSSRNGRGNDAARMSPSRLSKEAVIIICLSVGSSGCILGSLLYWQRTHQNIPHSCFIAIILLTATPLSITQMILNNIMMMRCTMTIADKGVDFLVHRRRAKLKPSN